MKSFSISKKSCNTLGSARWAFFSSNNKKVNFLIKHTSSGRNHTGISQSSIKLYTNKLSLSLPYQQKENQSSYLKAFTGLVSSVFTKRFHISSPFARLCHDMTLTLFICFYLFVLSILFMFRLNEIETPYLSDNISWMALCADKNKVCVTEQNNHTNLSPWLDFIIETFLMAIQIFNRFVYFFPLRA